MAGSSKARTGRRGAADPADVPSESAAVNPPTYTPAPESTPQPPPVGGPEQVEMLEKRPETPANKRPRGRPRKIRADAPAASPAPVPPVEVPKKRGRKPKERVVASEVAGLPTGNVVEIPIQAIDLDDTEFEFRVGARVKDLVEDIRRNGQQFPVVIRPTEGEKYQLISGFRRCRAIVALGWSRVRALIRTDLDEDGAYTLSYLENERRKSLTGADRAHAIVKLRLRGKSDEEIARIYGIGQRQIERYRKVSTFPEDLTRAVAEGRVPTTHGLLLMREMERRKGGFDLSEWIGRVEGETLSVRVLARRLNAAGSKRIPNVRYLERRGERAFRLYPMSYDPERTDETTRLAMLARLKEAVALLEDPAQP